MKIYKIPPQATIEQDRLNRLQYQLDQQAMLLELVEKGLRLAILLLAVCGFVGFINY